MFIHENLISKNKNNLIKTRKIRTPNLQESCKRRMRMLYLLVEILREVLIILVSGVALFDLYSVTKTEIKTHKSTII